MENDKLQVLLVQTGKRPKTIIIDNNLEAYQNIVSGIIQMYCPFDDDIAIICNDEGKLIGLPPNRAIFSKDGKLEDIIAGDFFICRAPYDSDKFESLTAEQIEKYTKQFAYPEKFSRRDGHLHVMKQIYREEISER